MTLRPLIPIIMSLLSLLALSSCSTSRIIDSERTFATGASREGSILESDIYLADGASLDVAYLSGSRVFLSSGATLSGLQKGVRKSVVYFEPGASFPNKKELEALEVEDAKAVYDDRFSALLPAGEQSRRRGAVVGHRHFGVGFGVGGHGFFQSRRFFRSRGFRGSRGSLSRSRPVSVQPASFRRR